MNNSAVQQQSGEKMHLTLKNSGLFRFPPCLKMLLRLAFFNAPEMFHGCF